MKLPPGHVAGLGVAKPKCTGGFGERMMRTMGWDTGQGLGKEGTGIKEAIEVKKKEDTVGVGGNGSYAWGDKWWEKAFDSAVQTVGNSDTDSDSSDSSDSDDEHMARIAAAVNRDGTRTSASADELKLLASLSKQGGRVAAGRFGGRDAKMARIRQQEASMAAEAAAKLGVPSAATTTAAATGPSSVSDRSGTTSEAKASSKSGSKKRKAAAAAASEQSGGQAASTGGKASKKKKKAAKQGAAGEADQQQQEQAEGGGGDQQPPKKQRVVIEPVFTASLGPVYVFVPTPVTGWWGEKRFASAGCLEGLDKTAAEAARRRMTFNEDDQARIYMNAQANKTQGKIGLGQGTGTVKVGGVKWEGKKVTFEETEGGAGESDEAAAAAAAAAADGGAGVARLQAIGSCTHLDALAGGGAGGGSDAQAEPSEGDGGGSREGWQAQVKWRKIIAAQLQGAEGRQLKVKELQRQVVAAVLAKHGGLAPGKAAVKAAFSACLEGSSKFVVEGKLVRMRG